MGNFQQEGRLIDGEEKFDQAECEHKSTVAENNRRDSIRAKSLPRAKIREGIENVIMKNLNIRHNVVSG